MNHKKCFFLLLILLVLILFGLNHFRFCVLLIACAFAATKCVTATTLNVRKGPATTYKIVGSKTYGAKVNTSASKNGWYQIGTNQWVSGKYLSSCSSGSTGGSTGGGSVSGGLTATQLTNICCKSKASTYINYLNSAMKEANINTKLRIAHFMAQLCHESGGLYYWEEIASGAAYEGRKDLGNTHAGDGKRYKGRGPIQITGRANYTACGKALGLDLVNHPELLCQPQYGFRSAAWFWKLRGLNAYADKDDIYTITRRVNGGTNGLSSRKQYLSKAKKCLGI